MNKLKIFSDRFKECCNQISRKTMWHNLFDLEHDSSYYQSIFGIVSNSIINLFEDFKDEKEREIEDSKSHTKKELINLLGRKKYSSYDIRRILEVIKNEEDINTAYGLVLNNYSSYDIKRVIED